MPSREADFKRREVKICSYKKRGGRGYGHVGRRNALHLFLPFDFLEICFGAFLTVPEF